MISISDMWRLLTRNLGTHRLPQAGSTRGLKGCQELRRERAFIVERERTGHQDMVIGLAPVDEQVATRQGHPRISQGKAAAHGRNRGGAGGGAASLGETGASLPGAQAQGARP